MKVPKSIRALKTKLESLKTIETAEKYAIAFKESGFSKSSFDFEFVGRNTYFGHDTIIIYTGGVEFSITYKKAVLF